MILEKPSEIRLKDALADFGERPGMLDFRYLEGASCSLAVRVSNGDNYKFVALASSQRRLTTGEIFNAIAQCIDDVLDSGAWPGIILPGAVEERVAQAVVDKKVIRPFLGAQDGASDPKSVYPASRTLANAFRIAVSAYPGLRESSL